MIVLALSALAAGEQEPIPHSGVASRQASEWRNRIDLAPVLSDSEAMKTLVIIYPPSDRQTLFVFGSGRLVLQTYPHKSFVDIGLQGSEIEFEKELTEHYIVLDDGTSRTYRTFAEGTYNRQPETIPPEFLITEKPLRGFVERLSDGKPCQLAHYMEWRGTARGESVH